LARVRRVAIIITTTPNTGLAAVHAKRRITRAAGVVSRVAEHAGIGHALSTIAVIIITTPKTGAAICRTKRRVVITAGVIRRVAGDAGIVHTLSSARLSTIQVALAADAT
jgi:hypothetical protein